MRNRDSISKISTPYDAIPFVFTPVLLRYLFNILVLLFTPLLLATMDLLIP
jgi:hypothetical protein